MFVDEASLYEARADCREIAGAHEPEQGVLPQVLRRRLAFDEQAHRVASRGVRQVRGEAGGNDARNRADSLEHTQIKALARRCIGILGNRHRNARRQDSFGPESRIDGIQVRQRLNEKPGTNCKDERHGNFNDHQRRMQPAAAVAKRTADVHRGQPRQVERRRPAEQESRENRNERGKCEHTGIDVQGDEAGNGVWNHPLQGRQPPSRDQQTGKGSGSREQQALGQHLDDDADRRCAERDANGDFLAAAHRARE